MKSFIVTVTKEALNTPCRILGSTGMSDFTRLNADYEILKMPGKNGIRHSSIIIKITPRFDVIDFDVYKIRMIMYPIDADKKYDLSIKQRTSKGELNG
jgi:hypothetical protein